VVELPIWVESWVHECCGDTRRVGDVVELDLTFEGDVQPAAGADQIALLDGGRVRVVGSVIGPASSHHTTGLLIESGALRFGIGGAVPDDRAQCVGRLAELRHGYPSWTTAGEVIGIQWRPGIEADRGGYTEIVDYDVGQELQSTEDWRPAAYERSWAFMLTLRIANDVAP
jgi:hypothetical protein